jgi:hypothetical protein
LAGTEKFPKIKFSAGTWLELKGLTLVELLIEIEMKVHKAT